MKTIQIRHPRLNDYYNSVTLNFTFIGILLTYEVSAYLLKNSQSALTDTILICGGGLIIFFIGYSIWFWTGKRKTINTDTWMSDLSSSYTLYVLICRAIDSPSVLWVIFTIAAAAVIPLIYLLRRRRKSA